MDIVPKNLVSRETRALNLLAGLPLIRAGKVPGGYGIRLEAAMRPVGTSGDRERGFDVYVKVPPTIEQANGNREVVADWLPVTLTSGGRTAQYPTFDYTGRSVAGELDIRRIPESRRENEVAVPW